MNIMLLFILDAAQVAGLIPIDMENFNIDILCFTGHKELFAPQGTGGIVLREGLSPCTCESWWQWFL